MPPGKSESAAGGYAVHATMGAYTDQSVLPADHGEPVSCDLYARLPRFRQSASC